MKKILVLIVMYIITTQNSFAQTKTRISGLIENAKDTIINIDLLIFDGQFAETKMQEFHIETNNGKFKFDFDLKRTGKATVYINNRIIFIPGSFGVLVNPGDNLTFTIPDVKKLGLDNMNIDGKGSDKLNLLKAINHKLLATGIHLLFWDRTSITEKYKNADIYLNIIDSMCSLNKLKDPRDMKLIKAQLVDGTLDQVLAHSVKYYSDSVAILFEKYIKRKNRIEPFLNKEVINYYGGRFILPSYMLLSNRDKIQGESHIVRFTKPLDYNKLIVNEFDEEPYVRDFLLSYFTRDFFRAKWDSPVSQDVLNFYVKHVNKNNPHFQEVLDTFEDVQKNLKRGDAFYNFNLPDTTGRRHQLADFKGKIILLDFWFNGCFACKGIAPSIEKAEEYFKGKDIQFISIGIDKNEPWKKGIGIFSSKNSLQLYTEEQRMNHDIIKFAKVTFYPRLIVLDKNGNIIGVPPNPATDFEGFTAYLNKLL
ncbi:hypothetical protein DRF65_11260 [Chryseobacterium pennae]|uniref:Thioredoxin domain-containing protein n=1 Tax=Chryseobacterium pennae TaxID=2258962 RepID=A0A3D9C967_9FLAO|nr:TlpA disulfide reductase family protein [Chryseobacterium pennae]REC62284.1 hypothetical protein DRF65_11260 [Chryseobacterium pennae]